MWTSLFSFSWKKKCWKENFWYNCVVFHTVFFGNIVFVLFWKWSIVRNIVWNILPLCRSLVYGFCFSEEQTKKYSTTATSLHTSVPFWPETMPSRKSWRVTRTTMSVRLKYGQISIIRQLDNPTLIWLSENINKDFHILNNLLNLTAG